ncbi:MAG: replicative DNA helicase [Proteobacteria bacterium]|nr:replicative DNA helicase [Pseudomonadota bacterium]
MTTLAKDPSGTRAAMERIPPQNLEAEMSLLGSLLVDREAIGMVLPILTREEAGSFYHPHHRVLFEVLVDLYDELKAIDLVTMTEELNRRNLLAQIGGIEYLVTLAESVPSSANAEHYARIVRDKGMLRDLIRCTDEISDIAYADDEPAEALLDQAEEKLFAVTERRISRHASQLRELLQKIYGQIEAREDNFISGLPSGFTELDDLTSGFQPGDFIIVAGRPSMGKTAFGLSVAEHMAITDGLPVAFFSMEMSNYQVAQRILCSRGRIDSHKFRRHMLSEQDIQQLGFVCEQLADAPLYVDDTPGMTVLELRAKIRRLAQQHNIRAAFVDYLQLMHTPRVENRQQEIATISRGLKSIGRELNIPIIAMAQLNRQAEGREGHRPRMSDLRESGTLEQDADVILLIHREEYFKPDKVEVRGIAEIIVAKQRNGPTETIRLSFNKKLTRFDNLSLTPEPVGYSESQEVPF